MSPSKSLLKGRTTEVARPWDSGRSSSTGLHVLDSVFPVSVLPLSWSLEATSSRIIVICHWKDMSSFLTVPGHRTTSLDLGVPRCILKPGLPSESWSFENKQEHVPKERARVGDLDVSG